MIENFEEITDDLTNKEKELIPGFVSSFKKRIGKENAITAAQIIAAYYSQGITITGPRVRAIIHYLRDGWLIPGLLATSNGYYVSNDPEEIESYIRSLGQREASIRTIRIRMEEFLKQIKKRQNENTKEQLG